jgi:hypothetical protein
MTSADATTANDKRTLDVFVFSPPNPAHRRQFTWSKYLTVGEAAAKAAPVFSYSGGPPTLAKEGTPLDRSMRLVDAHVRDGDVMEIIDAERSGKRLQHFLSDRSVGEWVGAAVIVAGACALIGMFLWVRVCNDQITDAGVPVRACRHLEIADPPLVAVGFIMLVALSPFFSEISGFGVTVKSRLAKVEQKVERVEDQTQRTASTAAAAQMQARDALMLAAQYGQVRTEYPRGPARDKQMRRLWDALVDGSRGEEGGNLRALLGSTDFRERLTGYAYAYANPNPAIVRDLSEAVLNDDTPFNQEMGIRALRTVLEGHCDLLTPDLRERLDTLTQRLLRRAERKGRPSKRVAEIERLLQSCPE